MTDIDQIVTAVVAACRTAQPGRVEVFDGQARDPQGEFLNVGWAGDTMPGVEFTSVTTDAGMTSSMLLVDVTCLLTLHDGSWDGAVDAGPSRMALLSAYNAYVQAIRGDADLTDLLMCPAHVNRGQLMGFADEGGAEARMSFTVQCRAMTYP